MKKISVLIVATFIFCAVAQNASAQNAPVAKSTDVTKPSEPAVPLNGKKPEAKNDALAENGSKQNQAVPVPPNELKPAPQFKPNPYTSNFKPLEPQPMKLPDSGPAPAVVPMTVPPKN